MAEAKAKKPAAKKAAPKAKAEKKPASGKTIRITQTGSPAGRIKSQEATLKGLGLGKRHKTRELADTPEVRDMINAVRHLVRVEEAA